MTFAISHLLRAVVCVAVLASFSTAAATRRGLYLELWQNKPDTLYAFLLGDVTKEDALFRYCRTRGINALSLYNLHVVLPPLTGDLRSFMKRARREAGIRWIEAISAAEHWVWDEIATYQNASTDDDEMFDGALTEIEYWQSDEKPVDEMLEPVRYMKSLYPRARRNLLNPQWSKFYYASYIGWPDYGQIKNDMAAELDFVFMHKYVRDPMDAFEYGKSRDDELFDETSDLRIVPIYSAEGTEYHAENGEPFSGDWFEGAPNHTVQTCEDLFWTATIENRERAKQLRVAGFQYFTYYFMGKYDTDEDRDGPWLASDSNITWALFPKGSTWQNTAWCGDAAETGSSTECQNTALVEMKHDVVFVDLFDTEASAIAALKPRMNGVTGATLPNRTIVCYYSAGSYEDWRPDAASFTAPSRRAPMGSWPEDWLEIFDTTTLENVVKPIMLARLQLAAYKGCDAVEPDNVDCYANSACLLSIDPTDGYQAQLAYNQWTANEAHALGLAVGLKNDLDQVADLQPFYDFAVNEQCGNYGECDTLLPFLKNDKAVFRTEYETTLSQWCADLATTQSYGQFFSLLHADSIGLWRDCDYNMGHPPTPTATVEVDSEFPLDPETSTVSLPAATNGPPAAGHWTPTDTHPQRFDDMTTETLTTADEEGTRDNHSSISATLAHETTVAPATIGPSTPSPSSTAAPSRRFRIRIRGSGFADLLANGELEVRLRSALQSDLAVILTVHRNRVVIRVLSIGSLIAEFDVAGGSSATSDTDALAALNGAMQGGSSVFPSVQVLYANYTTAGQNGEMIALLEASEISTDDTPTAAPQNTTTCSGACAMFALVVAVFVTLIIAVGIIVCCCRRKTDPTAEAKAQADANQSV
jgi:hypothetical protein